MTKGLNEQVEEFRNRSLTAASYPVLWIDAMYEKVRYASRVVSMVIEPMLEESQESYKQLFEKLKKRGLSNPKLIISDAHKGLVAAITSCFPGTSWQRCKVHFMRNILIHVPHKDKERFAGQLKGIWQASDLTIARQRAKELGDEYGDKCPKAINILEDGLEDALTYLSFPQLDSRKVSSKNMLESLNREIQRRTKVVGIFPSSESYLRLVTMYLIEYSEDW